MENSQELINRQIRRYQNRISNSDRINELLNSNDISPSMDGNGENSIPPDLPDELREIDNELELEETNVPTIVSNLEPVIRNLDKSFKMETGSVSMEQNLLFLNNISRLDIMDIVDMNKTETDNINRTFYCGYINQECKPHGYGMIMNQNDDYIKGHFEDGLRFVKNAIAKISNIKYESEILNSIPDGNGKMDFLNGNIYNGNISNGFQNGKGRMVYRDRTIYDGEWNMGIRDGYGEYIDRDNIYKGEWKEDKKHGNGELHLNGIIYKGKWFMDLKHGDFTETSSSGSSYILKYENDILIYRGTNISGEVLELQKKLQDEQNKLEQEQKKLEQEQKKTKKILEERKCKICLVNEQNIVLISCGHLICDTCVLNLDQYQKKCPICRARFTRYVNIYAS